MNEPEDRGPVGRKLREDIGALVDDVRAAGEAVIRKTGVESLGEGLKETIQSALSGRDTVVMVRLNKSSLARLDELVDAGLVGSRSESAAFLVGEGIKAKEPLFTRIAEKIEEIRKVKSELRELLDDPPADDEPAEENQP